jgi:DNA-binding transcriptional ArsR family regulator
MNELATTTSVDLSLEQCDDLLVSGMCSVRDAILGYTKHGLTQTQISERVKSLGLKGSERTIRRHVADLRADGLLPAVGESRATQYRRKAEPVSNGLMRQPTPVPPSTTETNNLPLPTNDEPPEQLPAVVCEVVEGDDPERDYLRALECIDELFTLTKRYFHTGWDKRKWYELAGECRTIEACCNAHCGSKHGEGIK